MKTVIFTSLFFLFSLVSYTQDDYKVVYHADSKGLAKAGDLEALSNAVQAGSPLRVGWKLKFQHPETGEVVEMQHWTDAGFVTTLGGHVFAQIQGIFQQGPAITSPPGVFLASDQPDSWVAIIGTTGVMRQKFQMDTALLDQMKAIFPDEETYQEELKKMEMMQVETMWAVPQSR
ncbi:MAG: hypothetical protein KTR13_06875 [Saprospiraceae bacterium]|nr:hypothetical protein [Saprospiraceae bacterium]